ncbi:hypothetical protein F5888DRAFT_703544 [Russula emetica]|nr:hypothetical protein F5888DRAFT_703544 [Russula emetica]
MSARQPFVPSRPASRAVNLSEETRAVAKDAFAHAVSSTNNNASNTTSTEKRNSGLNLDLEGSTNRSLNISSFKKSASRSTGSNAGGNTSADPGSDSSTTHNQNQNRNLAHGGGSGSTGLLGRSKSSGVNSRGTPRIYAPRPFTPGPPATGMTPQGSSTVVGFPAPEFKTPSLPFAAAKGAVDDTAVAAQTRPSGQSHRITSSSSRHQSFFGGAHEQFSFDGPGDGNNNMDDDSGYYSSVSMSEQNENDGDDEAGRGDQLATSPMNRIQNRNGAAAASAFRRPPSTSINPAASNEVPGQQVARGGVNARAAAVNPDFDASFANLTKRIRPASPEDNEDIVLVGGRSHQSELSKRPCVRPSHSSSLHSSHGSLPRASVTPLENVSCGESHTVLLPHNVPHPIEGFPGLEFSEADLERYAELYEKGTERWSRSTMDEWLAGANDIMTKFTEIMDMVSHSHLPLIPVLVSVVFLCHSRFIATDQGTHEFQGEFVQVFANKARERTLLS